MANGAAQAKKEARKRHEMDNQMNSQQLSAQVTVRVAEQYPGFALQTLFSHRCGPDVASTLVLSPFQSPLPPACPGCCRQRCALGVHIFSCSSQRVPRVRYLLCGRAPS